MPIKKEIIYPFFLECCQYTKDAFWEEIFEDLAYGKTPYGTYISKNFICCSFKNREFTYKIERKDPKLIHEELYSLLSERLGLISHKDKVQQKIIFTELENSIKHSQEDWTNIRKKNTKNLLYGKYVIEMKNKYSLSQIQTRYLLSIIILAVMFKTITTKDIEYHDGKIHNINGIEFKNGDFILKRPLCTLYNLVASNETEITGGRLVDNWEKYIKNLRALHNRLSKNIY